MSPPLRTQSPPWRPSAILLMLAGISVAAIGLYFLAWRPPLLPEDLRFLGMDGANHGSLPPRLPEWLSNVFHVLGGHALASGLLAVALAATGYRQRRAVAVALVVAAGISGMGLMALTNFVIGSDFRRLLLGLAALWAASLVCFVVEGRAPTSTPHFTSKGIEL